MGHQVSSSRHGNRTVGPSSPGPSTSGVPRPWRRWRRMWPTWCEWPPSANGRTRNLARHPASHLGRLRGSS